MMELRDIFAVIRPFVDGYYKRCRNLDYTVSELRNIICMIGRDIIVYFSQQDPHMQDGNIKRVVSVMNTAQSTICTDLKNAHKDSDKLGWQVNFLNIMNFFDFIADCCGEQLPDGYWAVIDEEEAEEETPEAPETPADKAVVDKQPRQAVQESAHNDLTKAITRIAEILERIDGHISKLLEKI